MAQIWSAPKAARARFADEFACAQFQNDLLLELKIVFAQVSKNPLASPLRSTA
jgi:hypothetical protein